MKRAIDANLNRAREGLRVLEDIARFILNDEGLSAGLKDCRHSLASAAANSYVKLLSERNASGDVAAFLDPVSEQERAGLVELVLANAKRVQESLRVLEECCKVPDLGTAEMVSAAKRTRFFAYDVEKAMIGRLLRRESSRRISGLYVIIDSELVEGRNETDVAREAIAGGARVIQIRDKSGGKGRLLRVAAQLREICDKSETLLIVNDHPDVAILVGADGVHVGQKDLPVSEVRRLVPIDMLVGCSTATVDEARKAVADGADYLGVGAMFPTSTKLDTRSAGLATMRDVRQAVAIPLVGIGGINAGNACQVMEAGADAVAVISAVVLADDIRLAAEAITRAIGAGDGDRGSGASS